LNFLFIIKFMIYTGAGILFYKKNKDGEFIHLGKRTINPNKGEWSIPGGKKESKDIDLLYTAIRETNEEYFLNKNVIKYNDLKTKTLKHKDITFPFVFEYRIFLIKVKNINPVLPKYSFSEFSKVGWFNLKELPNRTHFGVLSALEEFQLINKK